MTALVLRGRNVSATRAEEDGAAEAGGAITGRAEGNANRKDDMDFKPRSETEILESMLWPRGDYAFEIIAAKEKTSSKGKQMIEVHLRITDGKGRSRAVRDYLLPEMALKFKHALDACGLVREYRTGRLRDTDLIGKSGRLRLRIEKDRTKQYPDKNVVADYMRSHGNGGPQGSADEKRL